VALLQHTNGVRDSLLAGGNLGQTEERNRFDQLMVCRTRPRELYEDILPLIRWLLDNDFVDEMNLLIIPVVLGQGTRLFPDAGPDIALDLVDSRADSKGVTIQVYRPTGRPRYATATADHDDG
jgi:hypothetical protein